MHFAVFMNQILCFNVAMFLEGARRDIKVFFNDKIRSSVASASLVADHRLDDIDEKFTPGIALAVRQLQGCRFQVH